MNHVEENSGETDGRNTAFSLLNFSHTNALRS